MRPRIWQPAAGCCLSMVGTSTRPWPSCCANRGFRKLGAARTWVGSGVAQGASGLAREHQVQRAGDAPASYLEHVGVDHGGADIGVTEQLLHGADVIPGLQQVGGK